MCWKIFFFVFLILAAGCGKNSKEKKRVEFRSTTSEGTNKYFIEAAEFKNNADAFNYAVMIKGKVRAGIFIDTINNHTSNEKYIVSIGDYNHAYSAGQDAFHLLTTKVLSNYILTRNRTEVVDPFINFIYIAQYDSVPALFNYNMKTNESRLFWHSKTENLIDIAPSKNELYCFAVTSTNLGQKGSFPFINQAKLYHISIQDQSISEIYNFGDGIQLYAFWITPNLYRVGFNYLHKSVANAVVEQSIVFNFSGNLLSEETKFYDLVKEDYPYPPLKPLEISSPTNEFTLSAAEQGSVSALYLYENRTQNKTLIYKSKQALRKTEWSDQGDYLMFSTSNIYQSRDSYHSSGDSSEIIIYSLEKKQITKHWKSKGNKNFFLRGDIIFLDNQSGPQSYILVYNYRHDKKVVTIKRPGGCGFSLFTQLSDDGEK